MPRSHPGRLGRLASYVNSGLDWVGVAIHQGHISVEILTFST